jgi:hypothetical protein
MEAITGFFVRGAGMGSVAFLSLCLASTSSTSSLLFAQSVTFADAQVMLPTVADYTTGVAVDSTGNVFVTPTYGQGAVELPWVGSGYGPQVALPTKGLNYPQAVAVDGAGNVYIATAKVIEFRKTIGKVVELPKTPTGWGPQMTVPFSGLTGVSAIDIDSHGDVFVADWPNNQILELPWTGVSYGPQVTLPFSGLFNPEGVAVNGAGDVFVSDYRHDRVVELPRTQTGYGPQITLRDGPFYNPQAIAFDSVGDLFVVNVRTGTVVELPKTQKGFGPQKSLLSSVGFGVGLAVDGSGNVFTSTVEFQTRSVNFWSAYVCPSEETTPTGCNKTLTLNYNVSAGVTLGTPEVLTGGVADRDFTLSTGSTCIGAVTQGSSCTVNVTFAPLSAGTRNGTVEIVDSSGTVLSTTNIYGLGLEATGNPEIQVSPTYLQFGPSPINLKFPTPGVLPVTISNIGRGGPLTVAPSISTYSGGQIRSYSIEGSNCAAGIMPGYSCTLQVAYAPKSIATHYGLLTLQTNGEANPVVKLHGVGTGLSVLGGVSGGSLQFGSVSSGSTKVLPLTITNVGLPDTVTLFTQISKGYTTNLTTTYKILTTEQNTCLADIAPGQSCTLPVEFAPTSSGIHDDLLILTGANATYTETLVWLIGSTP